MAKTGEEAETFGFMPRVMGAVRSALGPGSGRWFIVAGTIIVAFIVGMSLLAPFISPHGPTELFVGPDNSPPSSSFPLGTDQYGRDMLSRIIWGGRFMLLVAVTAVILCLAVGVPIGLASAYRGGSLDKVVSLVMDSMYAFPSLVLAIVIIGVFGVNAINEAIAIAVVYVPSYYRVIRSQVLTIKELPYVEAAKSIGGRSGHILTTYILPNILPSIVVVATINFADSILTTAGLDFIGLGRLDQPDWGVDLFYGRAALPIGAWWTIFFSGTMIVLSALGFGLISEGLAERAGRE
ncbi:MAG: ABC transporter permease [Conexivisphaerales archaeon]|jgi:peptide/nickel transport system permease protein